MIYTHSSIIAAFLVVGIFFLVFEIALLLTKGSRSDRIVQTKLDQGSLVMIWIAGTMAVISAVIAARLLLTDASDFNPLIPSLGFLITCIGIAIRWVSINTLQDAFNIYVSVPEDGKLVKNGIYKNIRHPSYLGLLLAYLGLGIILSNWISLMFIFLPIFIAILHRIRIEEAVLTDALGEEYLEYCRGSYRFVRGVY